MNPRDKLLALKQRFPERHCSRCGELGGDLIEKDGYLWHRGCLEELQRRSTVTCWHCGRPTMRPRRLAWGKDLIPLHEHCTGAWIDAWDELLRLPPSKLACEGLRNNEKPGEPGGKE